MPTLRINTKDVNVKIDRKIVVPPMIGFQMDFWTPFPMIQIHNKSDLFQFCMRDASVHGFIILRTEDGKRYTSYAAICEDQTNKDFFKRH
jgi:hypothetical protein